jgi:signal transduction histidine kinase
VSGVDTEFQARSLRRQAVAMTMLQRLRPVLLHELKGPLQAILSAAHMLRKTQDQAATAENVGRDHYADVIRGSVQQLIAISETLLPRDSSADGEAEFCKLSTLTERVIRLLRDVAALEGVTFMLEVDPAPNTELRADRESLQLALTSVLVATLDRTPANAALTVAIDAAPAALHWRVQAPSHPGRANPDATLFDWRPEVPESLGWSVARDIVTVHGGTMRLADRGGQGWTLTLEFPVGSRNTR